VVIPSTENAKGVVESQSYGLQFTWLKKGAVDGRKPVKGDVVLLDYTQQPVGGKIFDQSSRSKIPIAVMLGLDVILPAWQDAIMQLVPGDSVKVIIPNQMAYGKDEMPKMFPPGSDLEIHMTLKSVLRDSTLSNGVVIHKFFNGNGVKPVDNNDVTIQYRAFHKTGKMYDLSAKNGGPFTFVMGQDNMMPGLMEACRHLRVGDWAYITIPTKEAYGAQGLKNLVPPNMDVVYVVEIVNVQ
jgi:FKBP-type peptidyl-prolyl cis-trans isomerase